MGVIEMVVGLAILTKHTRAFAYVAAAWRLAIAVNLLTTGRYLDVAVRDVILALAAFTLGRLSEARAKARVPERVISPAMRPAASHA